MIEIELAQLGYYKPGFLHLNINTNLELVNLNSILDNEKELFSTFLHEYIHFLQNLTTTSGFYQSTHYIQFLKDIVWNINGESENFEIPLKINNKFNRISQNELHSIYIGDIKNFKSQVIYQDYYFEEKIITSIDGTIIKSKKYFINYVDLEDRNNKKYHFGSYAIKEYIAHSIQNKFFEVNHHPDIPYSIVDLIIEKEIPKLSDELDLKIILCDATLMSLHPAQIFFETIKRLKEIEELPKTPSEMSEFVFKDLSFEGHLGKFNKNELFEKYFDEAIYDYSDALKSEIFKTELDWLKHIFQEAKKLRLSQPNYILNLVIDGEITTHFTNIIKNLGTPFFTNNAQYGGFIAPQNLKKIPNQTYLLAIVAEVISVIFGQKGCRMYNFCSKESTKKMTNENCLTEPWKKMDEKELCPFCQLWKTWGIYNKTPRKK